MTFNHQAANNQIAAIIGYAGVPFLVDGLSCEYKGLLDRQTGTAELGDFGFAESVETRLTVSSIDFPSPPGFGKLLTIVEDGSKYTVGHAERVKGGWEVKLKALDLSTAETA